MFLLIYVDDIILAGKDKTKVNKFKEKLKGRFKIKDVGELNTFLGINIKRKNRGLFLNQTYYLQKLLERFKMTDCKLLLLRQWR